MENLNKKINKKIVIVNQAVNYLTIGLANAFYEKFNNVSLITGSIHIQGEKLNENIKVTKIFRWKERPFVLKLLSYIIGTFQIFVLLLSKFRKHDVFYISLPPWAYILNLFLPNKFSVLVWDVYPDILKIMGMKENNPIYKIWSWLNKKSFFKVYKLYTIGSKTSELLSRYVDSSKIIITPIWSIFNEEDKIRKKDNYFIKEYNLDGKFVVQYSGNIGLTHNAECVIELAMILKNYENIHIQIIGRGPQLPLIKKLVYNKSLTNCIFLPFQNDNMFPHSLSAADIGIVILDERVAKGSVPSKSYNLMSFGIPSLYIAPKTSELYDYAVKYRHGECFSKNEISNAADFVVNLANDSKKYLYYSDNALKASKNFQRKNADDIVENYMKLNEIL